MDTDWSLRFVGNGQQMPGKTYSGSVHTLLMLNIEWNLYLKMNKVNPDSPRQLWTLRIRIHVPLRSYKVQFYYKKISTSRYFISATVLPINYQVVSGASKIPCEHYQNRSEIIFFLSLHLIPAAPENQPWKLLPLVSSVRHSEPGFWVQVSFGVCLESNSPPKSKFLSGCLCFTVHLLWGSEIVTTISWYM